MDLLAMKIAHFVCTSLVLPEGRRTLQALPHLRQYTACLILFCISRETQYLFLRQIRVRPISFVLRVLLTPTSAWMQRGSDGATLFP